MEDLIKELKGKNFKFYNLNKKYMPSGN